MARRKQQKRWSFKTGTKGVNRVRVFEHAVTGKLSLEFYENSRRLTQPLETADKGEAKAQAERLAAAFRAQACSREQPVTLHALLENYVREVSPRKSASKVLHDHRVTRVTLEILGGERLVSSLSHRDALRWLVERQRRGDLSTGRRSGRPVGSRVLAYDLAFVRAVFNWAVGADLIDRNPWRGFKPELPKYTPRRPMLSGDEYESLLSVAYQVAPGFKLALVLAYESGHRIGAIRQLRWSDIDFGREIIRWRVQSDKMGLGHETPMSQAARIALLAARQQEAAIGDRWVFPAQKDAEAPVSALLVQTWWDTAERLAQLPREHGRGWHSCRRTFATELKGVPLKDLCALGGWKNPQTILQCYQRADPVTMRQALATRKRLEA
jgi:integrase